MAGFGLRPRVVDGSGLSRANRTTPRQVVTLLDRIGLRGRRPRVRDLIRGGRAQRHAVETACAAPRRATAATGKTGTLRDVSALAGYCQTTAGSRVAFAILMNRVNPYGARRLQDRMVSALARYSP